MALSKIDGTNLIAPTIPVASGGTGSATLAGAGLANTPYFQAAMSTASQALSDNTAAKVAFNVATYDSGSTYDTTNYRWTPAVAGKYFISTSVYASADSDSEMQTTMCDLRKNGSIIYYIGNLDSRTAGYGRGKVNAGSVICELDDDDYVEIFAKAYNKTWDCEADNSMFFGYLIGGA